MKMRLAVLFVITALLSVFLVGCGDEIVSIPSYSGATVVALSNWTKSSVTNILTQVKNPTVEGFKTTDDVNKIRSNFESRFKSAGWDDKSSDLSNTDGTKQMIGLGVVVLGYQKGKKAAIIMAFQDAFAESLGFTGLNANENAILVISGNQAYQN